MDVDALVFVDRLRLRIQLFLLLLVFCLFGNWGLLPPTSPAIVVIAVLQYSEIFDPNSAFFVFGVLTVVEYQLILLLPRVAPKYCRLVAEFIAKKCATLYYDSRNLGP